MHIDQVTKGKSKADAHDILNAGALEYAKKNGGEH